LIETERDRGRARLTRTLRVRGDLSMEGEVADVAAMRARRTQRERIDGVPVARQLKPRTTKTPRPQTFVRRERPKSWPAFGLAAFRLLPV
jgi:hypothetical protein